MINNLDCFFDLMLNVECGGTKAELPQEGILFRTKFPSLVHYHNL